MSRLIVYAGANGAGKSSLRAGGADAVDVEIDPDSIARQINPANPRAVDFAAGKEALCLFDSTLAEGRSLSLETTLTGRSVLGRMQAAKDAGYEVILRYVALGNPDQNIERVSARAASGGHWIEPDTIRRRVAGSLENLPAAMAIADRSVLLDNSGATHRQVLDVEKGQILFKAFDTPKWLQEQLPRIVAELSSANKMAPDKTAMSAEAATRYWKQVGDSASKAKQGNDKTAAPEIKPGLRPK